MVCGLFVDKNDDGSVWIDHQQPNSEHDDCKLKLLHLDDILDMDPVQIVPSTVHGEWNISKRNAMLNVTNIQDTNAIYEQFYKSNIMH